MMSENMKVHSAGGTWVVRAGGAVIGESRNALELVEAGRTPVIYFPRKDLAMALLDHSDGEFVCPIKGSARYFSIAAKSGSIADAAWSFENPSDNLAAIKDLIAFRADLVTVEKL